jgi:flagellar hook assembly protein FlgD
VLADPGVVTARVFDLQGRLVASISDAMLPAGEHELRWDGRTVGGGPAAAGVYWMQMAVNGHRLHTAKLVRIP